VGKNATAAGLSGSDHRIIHTGKIAAEAADALIGVVSSIQYSPLFDNDVNKKFVEAYKKKYNSTPDNAESSAYCAALVIKAALEATKGDTAPQN